MTGAERQLWWSPCPCSFDLLATFYLMKHRMPLVFFILRAHCWLMSSLVSTRASRPSLQCCFKPVSTQPVLVPRFILSRCVALHLLTHFSILTVPLKDSTATWHTNYSSQCCTGCETPVPSLFKFTASQTLSLIGLVTGKGSQRSSQSKKNLALIPTSNPALNQLASWTIAPKTWHWGKLLPAF